MNNVFAIVGGDERQVLLAKELMKENEVEIYGLEKELANTDNLENVIKKANIIISAIPFTRDNIYINTPLSNKKIEITKFQELTKNKKVFTGNDFLKNEEYNILNAELTVEAIIGILINELHIKINRSNILILGYGRIGSILLSYLKSLYSNVYCSYNNEKEKAWIKINNGTPVEFNNIRNELENNKIDCIVNTIPDIVLKEEELNLIKDTAILDVASKSCLDMDILKKIENKNNIKYIQKLGLPGKYFPKNSVDILKNIILTR